MLTADTVYFVAETSGCFDAGSKTYQFCKMKNGDRNIIVTENNLHLSKSIHSKQFKLFINRFARSAEHFKDEKNPTCTLTTDFYLSGNKEKIAFKNGTCENDYNPELFLLELIKNND